MHDLTGFQRDLLYIVAGLDLPKGLEVKEQLDSYYGTEINYGRLYPNLDTLIEKGLLNKAEQDGRTNEYSLTRRGNREIQDRRTWEDNYLN